jgi:hypothetical protein
VAERRQYLSDREKHDTMRLQGWRCACGCGAPVWPGGPVEYDHSLPLALGGPAKPDSALTPHCHTTKTRQDVKRISKADRQAKAHRGEKKRRGRKLQGRSFTGWRKFDGTIVRADV